MSLLLLEIIKKGDPDLYRWVGVKGGFEPLDNFTENFLILDNLAANSSKFKLEKVSDLLFSSRKTTIIITAGINPLKLMSEELNYSFNSLFYLDEGLHLQY